jgi:hypothetical protein
MKNRIPTLEDYKSQISQTNVDETIDTIQKVIQLIGPRGKAKEEDIKKLIADNNFSDDFEADIYGYYGIEPVNETKETPADIIFDIIIKHCTSLEGETDYNNAEAAAEEIYKRIKEFK